MQTPKSEVVTDFFFRLILHLKNGSFESMSVFIWVYNICILLIALPVQITFIKICKLAQKKP